MLSKTTGHRFDVCWERKHDIMIHGSRYFYVTATFWRELNAGQQTGISNCNSRTGKYVVSLLLKMWGTVGVWEECWTKKDNHFSNGKPFCLLSDNFLFQTFPFKAFETRFPLRVCVFVRFCILHDIVVMFFLPTIHLQKIDLNSSYCKNRDPTRRPEAGLVWLYWQKQLKVMRNLNCFHIFRPQPEDGR